MKNKKLIISLITCTLVICIAFASWHFLQPKDSESTHFTIHTLEFATTEDTDLDNDTTHTIQIGEDDTPLGGIGNNSKARNLSASELDKIRKKLVNSVNKERSKTSKSKAVSELAVLERTGNVRSKEIVTKWSHTRPDGSSWATVLSTYGVSNKNLKAGEDLAKVSTTAKENYSESFLTQISDVIHKSLMNSPTHKKVILNQSYSNIGVGIYSEVKNGKLFVYITEHFKNANTTQSSTKKTSISKATISGVPKTKAYTGKQIKPSITVKYSGKTLKKGTDYTISYGKNKSVGKATIKITGKGKYTGSVTKSFTITKRNVSTLTYSKISNKAYTGKQIKPSITVKYSGKTLKKGTDYTVSYGKNKSTGKATVKITGKGNYTGSVTKTFYIVPKKVTVSSVKSTAKKSVTVQYKKVTGASGYQISHQKSGSKNWTNVTVSSKSASKTLTKLASKKNYKVKVRAYKTVSGKKYYGTYSSVKNIKVK